jgi:hypothetical protein
MKHTAVAQANPTPPEVVETPPTPETTPPATSTSTPAGTQQVAVSMPGPSLTGPTTRPAVPKLAAGDPFAPAATQQSNLAPPPVASELPTATSTARPANAEPIPAVDLPLPTPLAASMRTGFTGRYETVLAAPAPRAYVAVMTRAAGGQLIVTRWDVSAWKPAGEATFLGRESDCHLSSDGNLVVRLSTFPSLSLQVYSYVERRFRDPVKLDTAQGEPTILGFAGPSLVLIHWRRAEDGASALEVVDAMAGKWTKRVPRIGNCEPLSSLYAISDDGHLAAVITRESKPGADGVLPPAQLELYGLGTTDRLAKSIPINQITWTGAVHVIGLAISPGRTEVSLLLENEGRGLMLSWDVETAKLTRQYLEQAGLTPIGIDVSQFTGNALNYLDGSNTWLVYGCSIYDVGNGQRLGALNLPAPIRQWVTGSTCYVYHTGEQGLGVMHAVKIDTAKLRSMLAKRGK